MDVQWRRRCSFVVSFCLIFAVLSACTISADKNMVLPPLKFGQAATIKVTYWDEEAFYRDYGNLFLNEFPNITVEVISTQGTYGEGKDSVVELKKLFEKEQPDVMLLGPKEFSEFVKDNVLYELDPVIRQDDFDLSPILPGLIELLKKEGDGKLYGLSPTFNSTALYYNKELFERYNIPLPRDGMSWGEVLQLSKRFPTDGEENERVYGFSDFGGEPTNLFYRISDTYGLSYVDPEGRKVNMKTDSWRNAAELTLQFLASKTVYRKFQEDPINMRFGEMFSADPFLTGRVGMRIDGSYYINYLKDAEAMNITNFDWDLVSIPVDPTNPTEGDSFFISSVFAINASSPNLRAAWEFVKYVNSDKLAKITSRSPLYGLPARTEYIRNDEGKHVEAFYSLKPRSSGSAFHNTPSSFIRPFFDIVKNEAYKAAEGRVTVDEMLNAIQSEGQAALDQAWQELTLSEGDQ
ncbi:ABC transporter substrate-binding protein [Paenibacillus thermotolerans]|uniref:ABC transporter substrate-binding protein n=1 Tax=Paenibacillus thermotolerans TaxID=3027807 RepID=UPI002368B00B|nr:MULTISPECIES: extracellular solute-binding protein [unclassified Paenibacillus]